MKQSFKKIISILTNRLAMTILAIVLQIVWLFLLMFRLVNFANWINIAFTVLSILIELHIVSKLGNPSYKILWLLLIGTFPVLGSLMYLMFGDKRPSRDMRRRLHHGRHVIGVHLPKKSVATQLPTRTGELSLYLEKCGFPMYQNTQIAYYPLGDDMFPQLLEDLRSAEHYIFMEYFIIADGVMWDAIKQILKEKAANAVEVRIVYDDIGSITCLPKNFRKELTEAGIKVMAFNPFRPVMSAVMNNRNHRKITVIDGYIAYTGGLNLADEYINQKERFGHWKDSAIRLFGEGAFSFTQMCLELWNAFYKTDDTCEKYVPHRYYKAAFPSDGYVQPYCNSPFENETLAQEVYIDLLSQAQRYVYIFTPYLAIDDEMQHALCMAAKRGIDVRIVVPGIPDKRVSYALTRSYYALLIRMGVRIYEYTPGFIHAKSYLVDDKIGVVGTINMDNRGLYLHMECAVLLTECSVLEKLKTDCLLTMGQSHRVSLQDCKHYRHSLIWQAILRTISPLM